LEAKKNKKSKEYYALLNRQGFLNAKEEPKVLRTWMNIL